MNEENIEYECMSNHLPDWIEPIDYYLHACMSPADVDRVGAILDKYNELSNREEDVENEDGFTLFGVEHEKAELVDEFISIHSKYREEAEKLSNQAK